MCQQGGKELGYEGLRDLLRGLPVEPSVATASALVTAVEEFRGSTPCRNDQSCNRVAADRWVPFVTASSEQARIQTIFENSETFWRLVTLILRAQCARRYVRRRLLVVLRVKSVRIVRKTLFSNLDNSGLVLPPGGNTSAARRPREKG